MVEYRKSTTSLRHIYLVLVLSSNCRWEHNLWLFYDFENGLEDTASYDNLEPFIKWRYYHTISTFRTSLLLVQHAMSSISTQFKCHISVITIWVDATSGTDLSGVEIRSLIFHRTNCRLTYWPLGDAVVMCKLISGMNMLEISCEMATTWMPQDLTDE